MTLETLTAAEARQAIAARTAARTVAPASRTAAAAPAAVDGGGLFEAVVDSVNPLQHLPVVSTVYRAATGDEISPLSRVAGGWLFGGPLGAALGAASAFIEMLTGQDPGQLAMGLLTGKDAGAAAAAADAASPPAGDGPLLGPVANLADRHAGLLNEAEGARRAGFGAKRDVVGWSANIWSQRAMTAAAGKYDATQSRPAPDSESGSRLDRVL